MVTHPDSSSSALKRRDSCALGPAIISKHGQQWIDPNTSSMVRQKRIVRENRTPALAMFVLIPSQQSSKIPSLAKSIHINLTNNRVYPKPVRRTRNYTGRITDTLVSCTFLPLLSVLDMETPEAATDSPAYKQHFSRTRKNPQETVLLHLFTYTWLKPLQMLQSSVRVILGPKINRDTVSIHPSQSFISSFTHSSPLSPAQHNLVYEKDGARSPHRFPLASHFARPLTVAGERSAGNNWRHDPARCGEGGGKAATVL